MAPTQAPKRGFTLIELLVVVAIIVILVAILVPALNKALYLATLATCSANMDGFATANITYAHSNKDSFPYRKALNVEYETPAILFYYSGQMGMLKYASDNQDPDPMTGAGSFDDRPLWATLLDVKESMLDPFVAPIDLLHPDTYGPDDLVLSSYDILVGWGWKGEGKMEKLGSKITYTNTVGGANPRTGVANPPVGTALKWDLLVMDRDIQVPDYVAYTPANGGSAPNPDLDEFEPAFTSHPDTDVNRMSEYPVIDSVNADKGNSLTVSAFMVEGPRDNKLDRNFAHVDGSVDQIRNIYAGWGMVINVIRPAARASQFSPAPYLNIAEDERMYVAPLDSIANYEGSNTTTGGNTTGSSGGGAILMPRR